MPQPRERRIGGWSLRGAMGRFAAAVALFVVAGAPASGQTLTEAFAYA